MKDILKDYINNTDLTNYKYLRINFGNERSGPGLCDQLFQLKLYLKIAHELGLILILPERKLQPHHNAGRIVSGVISEFYDIDCIKIDGNIVEVMENKQHLKSTEVLILKALKRTKEVDTILMYHNHLDYTVDFVRAKKDVSLANQVIKNRNIQGCIHIRRGDRLVVGDHDLTGDDINQATNAKQIIHLLDSTKAPRVIYIMSDMLRDDENIKELNKCNRYEFVFLYDIPWLCQVKIDNNYKAFNIELAIQESSNLSYSKSKIDVVKFWREENKT